MTPAMTPLTASVKSDARDLGFDLVGIAPADPSAHAPFYERWLEAGLHGRMEYLARPEARARRADLDGTLQGARSVVVVGHRYHPPQPTDSEDSGVGVIAAYARGRDYHKVIVPRLRGLHRRIESRVGHAVPGRAYADTGPILERELGVRAGLGWLGRNTMLIHPREGSTFLMGVLLLDLDLEPDPPFEADHCGSCRACLDACPTGALLGRDEDGAPVIDARRCISYLTIELRGPIPPDLRSAIGNRVFGCDICQEVCPFNVRFAGAATEPGYAARGPGERPVGVEPVSAETPGLPDAHPGTASPGLVELLATALDPNAWEAFSRGSAIRRAGRAGFARNVCVAIGNWLVDADPKPPDAIATLERALDDPDPLVVEHAVWALEVGGGQPPSSRTPSSRV